MEKTEFQNARRAVDKFFNATEGPAADKILTADEVGFLAAQAQEKVRRLFPKHAARLFVMGVYDPEDDFAGYSLAYAGAGGQELLETFEFDFGSEGVDVTE